MRKIFAGIGLVFLIWSGNAISAPSTPMRFSTFEPCLGNASCGTRILASGVIEIDSDKKLAAFITHSEKIPPIPTIVFDSPGGSILGALSLGKFIRSRGYDTALERHYDQEQIFSPGRLSVATNTVCASACSLAFLGGINRSIGRDALYGVHQFYSKDGKSEESVTQLTMTILARYLDDMGVDRRLLDWSSLVDPNSIRWLTQQEIQELRIDNTVLALSGWRIEADTTGLPMLMVSQQVAPDRDLSLAMRTVSDGVVIAVVAKLAKNGVGYDRREMFPVGEATDIRFSNDKFKILASATSVQPWKKLKTDSDGAVTFGGVAFITYTDLQRISETSTLIFNDNFPNVIRDLGITTSLSIAGLKNGASLLMRARR